MTASGGSEALARVAEEQFDLIFLDLAMPGMSGARTFKVRADDYVTKPVNLDELAVRLERAIERRATLAQNEQMHEAIGEFAELIEERRSK